jgi:predicted DNA-binding transcriptional regulator AlpA
MTALTTATASHSQEFLTPTELSSRIGIAVQTLARWRCEGKGPVFTKIGGKKVLYRASEVDRWLEDKDFESTGHRIEPARIE